MEGDVKSYWSDKRVLVTGGHGFLGSFVVKSLIEHGCSENLIFSPRQDVFDLRKGDRVEKLYDLMRPNVVFHLAGNVGGIEANRRSPGNFFYDNMAMGVNVIEQSRLSGVEKLVCIGTVCSYPKLTKTPFEESSLWDGYPEETNAPYGIAKKALLVQLQAYRQQYGMNGIFLVPTNLYGPGDNFDNYKSHVIPALIRKCVDANIEGRDSIDAWGTGRATRDFLYVEDAAEAIVLAAERYDKPEPVNLGSGNQISISSLLTIISELTGYEGKIFWKGTMPDGQPRRWLCTDKALREFGWEATTGLREGLRKTINWFVCQEEI